MRWLQGSGRCATLQDVEDYVRSGDYLWKWDAKAGYHMLFIEPAYWKYLCFTWEGRVYCWTCLPFGLQSACRTYSIVMGELHRLERELGGGLLSFVLDDKLGAARSLPEACFRCLAGIKMLTAAGVTFSLPKCELWPVQLLRWLGMQLHTVPQPFFSIPAEKLQYIYDLITGGMQSVLFLSQQCPTRCPTRCPSFVLLALQW
jgi:hypothetical protein